MPITNINEGRLQERINEVDGLFGTLAPYGGAIAPERAVALILQGISELSAGAGGGSGITPGQVQAAIEAAANLDQVEALLTAHNTTLTSVLTQLQGDRAIATQLFVDASGTNYIRAIAFNQQSNSYEAATLTLAGIPYTPILPETPIERSDMDTTETVWEIVTAGTGYSVGDYISQFSLVSQGPPPVVAGVLWYNQSTNATLAIAPLAGHRRRIGAVAATEATLAQVMGGVGQPANAAAPTDTATTGLIGLVKRLLQQFQLLLDQYSGPSTGAVTSIASTVTDTAIVSGNPARKGLMVVNSSTASLRLLFNGGVTSATNYSVIIGPNGYYELPLHKGGVYTGVVKGNWTAANGFARVTEFT